MREEAVDEHQVERPVAGHLIGDVHVAAARVPNRTSSTGSILAG
jgi:hypothetical protein